MSRYQQAKAFEAQGAASATSTGRWATRTSSRSSTPTTRWRWRRRAFQLGAQGNIRTRMMRAFSEQEMEGIIGKAG